MQLLFILKPAAELTDTCLRIMYEIHVLKSAKLVFFIFMIYQPLKLLYTSIYVIDKYL